MELYIRSSTARDLTEVTGWVSNAAECERWTGITGLFPIEPAGFAARIGFSSGTTYVLVDEQAAVAFGQLTPRSFGRSHLARILVRPDRRRQGLGTALVSALIHVAAESGAPRVSLNVNRENVAARAMYKRMGFVPVGRPPDESPSTTSVYMERTL